MQISKETRRSLRALIAAVSAFVCLGTATAQPSTTVNVYGPGGPAPAMKEAAKAFEAAHQIKVNVVAGPTGQWADKAKSDAHVVFSGAEHMMSDFARVLPGAFDLKEVQPLYLRPVAMLVRPGNPKGIKGFKDILEPGIKVLAVAGAGQTGLWEDVVGRTGDIRTVQAFRKNLLLPEASNSAEARKRWIEQPDIDVWLIWNIWQVANPELAQVVEMDEPFRIYRDTGVVLTQQGKTMQPAQKFVDYLQSPAGQAIFSKWGWKTR